MVTQIKCFYWCLVKCKLLRDRVFNLYPFLIIFQVVLLILICSSASLLADYYKIFSLFLLTIFLFAALLLLFMLIQLC